MAVESRRNVWSLISEAIIDGLYKVEVILAVKSGLMVVDEGKWVLMMILNSMSLTVLTSISIYRHGSVVHVREGYVSPLDDGEMYSIE